MIDIMPKKLISRKDLKNWQNYSAGLDDKKFTKKYLEATMKKWVEKLSNPLAIFWVQKLFEDKLEKLDENLKALEGKLSEKNLKLIFGELENEGGDTEAVIRKIKSLKGEITAFNKLASEGHKNLKKINQGGDWESDTIIISVKSVLDLDVNYQLLESTIRGMIYIQENDILRKYSRIEFRDEKKLDHKFRTKIVWFLENSFLNTLRFIDSELENTDDIKIKTSKSYVENNQQTGYLEICSHGYVDGSEKVVEITLRKDRAGEQKLEHQLKIELEDRSTEDSKTFSIGFGTNAYWEGQGLDLDYLSKSIHKHLEKFDKDKQNLKNVKDFVGWINISIHPMHECYVLGNKQRIKEFVRTIKCDRQYKVMFCLSPQMGFDLTEAIIFET